MKRFALVCALMFVPIAYAQSNASPSVSSRVSPDSRFEIVQSALVAKQTFKLDKFLGNVYLLVKTPDGSDVWEPMLKESNPADRSTTGKSEYQIFTSGIAARFTFLMNVNSGITWQLVSSKDGTLLWEKMP